MEGVKQSFQQESGELDALYKRLLRALCKKITSLSDKSLGSRLRTVLSDNQFQYECGLEITEKSAFRLIINFKGCRADHKETPIASSIQKLVEHTDKIAVFTTGLAKHLEGAPRQSQKPLLSELSHLLAKYQELKSICLDDALTYDPSAIQTRISKYEQVIDILSSTLLQSQIYILQLQKQNKQKFQDIVSLFKEQQQPKDLDATDADGGFTGGW